MAKGAVTVGELTTAAVRADYAIRMRNRSILDAIYRNTRPVSAYADDELESLRRVAGAGPHRFSEPAL